MMLTFEAGPRVIYKPKNMSLESHLPAINHWLAAEGSEIVFRFPKCLGNRAYGWAEVIQQQECRSEQEVREFYHHAGHFLGLAYFLNATDLSYESLVASGPWPVPIDLETFFYPEMRPFPGAVHAAAESKPDPPARPAGHGSLDLLGKFALPSKLRFYGLSGSSEGVPPVQKLVWSTRTPMKCIRNMLRCQPGKRRTKYF
jgi:hypothetical protein